MIAHENIKIVITETKKFGVHVTFRHTASHGAHLAYVWYSGDFRFYILRTAESALRAFAITMGEHV